MSLKEEFESAKLKITCLDDVEVLRRDWLGKEGLLKVKLAGLKELPAEERPKVAKELNELKVELESFLKEKLESFGSQKLDKLAREEFIDVSLPASYPGVGKLHPIRYVERKIISVLKPFGFEQSDGPEIETEYFCFDSLNIPKHHPARDMQDTFFTDSGHVLRTHTSSMQARALSTGKLPLKRYCLGRCYRNETEDASHQAMFHQMEFLWVEKGITLANLMAVCEHLAKNLYGKRHKVKFVPKFYPYTEPSIGVQIDCNLCKSKGCSFCGFAGWVTVAGAGMIHHNVLNEFGYDPKEVTGFAAGLGTSRLAAQFFDLPRGKMLYEGDLRVLKDLK